MSGPSAPSTDIDALFKLPLGEFTSARNALVTQLKKAGRQGEANEAKALVKPSVAAWVVNQLYWQHRGAFDRLIEAGDRFRQAQSAEQPRNSASARESLEARREAQVTLVRMATDVLRNGGYSDTRDTMRRVTSTLEALSIYGSLPDAPRAGRLAAEVDPPGFDMFAVLLPLGNKTQERPPQATGRRGAESEGRPAHRKKDELGAAARGREDERRRLVTAAKAAVRDAERALRAARSQVERTATTRQAAAKQAKDAEHRRAEIESQLAKVAALANAASERAREAEAGAQEAAKAAESAERALELASRRLEQLTADND